MTGRKVRSRPLVGSVVKLIGSRRFEMRVAGVNGKRKIGRVTGRKAASSWCS
jgi:hypothetical protein